jgi:peptidoglycan-associated lipoprotein
LPAIFSAAIGLGGCAHRELRSAQKPVTPPAKAAAKSPAEIAAPDKEPNVREATLHQLADLKAVRFDFDSADLGAGARAILVQNAEWLKNHLESRAQAAGYCDERGTVEYNLALGQRRAQAVKEYYRALGIPEGRVATISYGKEKPLCGESNEECWRKNRRVETLVAFPETMSQVPKGDITR